ncbi:S24 family peptidase [Vibrio hippocampi]|uniref:Peptidase S24/S26A/S26B/S26C domain-containing protein n=1 Tax=Vibrio hippocampi TaxID=654686 RepID=A0ABM8ZF29_9VIBR|nr:S24 family peptidase [Vibrio hippocampi]CAH0525128.1 hypothetical protein VHP8226_00794 [Vibrio hippocampi]
MDRYEVRRLNLLRIRKDRFDDKNAMLARAIDREASYVSRMLSPPGNEYKKRISEKMIEIIETALRLPSGYLDDPAHCDQTLPLPIQAELKQVTHLDNMMVWNGETPLAEDEVAVPLLSDDEMIVDDNVIREPKRGNKTYLKFTKSMLYRYAIEPEDAICVTMLGKSMEPVLPQGCTLGINCGDQTLVDGSLYVLAHAGEVYIRKLYHLPGQGMRVVSINHTEYPAREYTRSEISQQNITILGRVFWYSVIL